MAVRTAANSSASPSRAIPVRGVEPLTIVPPVSLAWICTCGFRRILRTFQESEPVVKPT